MSESSPVKEILLVGLGAVGAICEFKQSDFGEGDLARTWQTLSSWRKVDWLGLLLLREAITTLLRVRCEFSDLSHYHDPLGWSGDGIHFQSRKYGNIKGWKPDRRQYLPLLSTEGLSEHLPLQYANQSQRQRTHNTPMSWWQPKLFPTWSKLLRSLNLCCPRIMQHGFLSRLMSCCKMV
jgi:hypothetical protein